MYKAIKATMSMFTKKMEILILENKVKSMKRDSYLSLWERIELRNATALLESMK
ncbi:MAG: hypothetical protein ABIO04_03095 [Ferruginibacter sp.]